MEKLKDFRSISPVALRLPDETVSCSLYRGGSGLVESFLVQLYRCRLCRFTSALESRVSRHADTHDSAVSSWQGDPSASPYDLDPELSVESKPGSYPEDQMGFLLPMYGMLSNMSPRSCDLTLDGPDGLAVAQTCEVSTLFEDEVSSMFLPSPDCHDDHRAQSAHLMTLGLCRRVASLCGPHSALPSPQTLQHSSHSAQPSPQTLQHSSHSAQASPQTLQHSSHSAQASPQTLQHSSHSAQASRNPASAHPAPPRTDSTHTHSNVVEVAGCRTADDLRVHHKKKSSQVGARKKKRKKTTEPPGRGRSELAPSTKKKQKGGKKKQSPSKNGGGRDFCCSICNRSFSSRLTLRRHMGIHQGERPYRCPTCSYSSRLKASLLQHTRTHTGEKPFRCHQCSYASIDRSSLRRHSRTHSQEKPYQCELCPYRSIQKKSLDLHARRHHTGESFPCQQCSYSSPDRQLLLRHIRRNHTLSNAHTTP